MSYPVIEIETRTAKGSNKLASLRLAGKTPGILYGHNDKKSPELIQCNEAMILPRLAEGRKFFNVKDSQGQETKTFVSEVQVNELTDQLLHIDFQRIEPGDRVSLKIPLIVKGTPAGARIGGRLEVFLHELRIEGDAQALVEEFVLDVSKMEVGDRVTLETIALPEGVKPLGSPNTTVCIIHAPKGARSAAESADDKEDDGKPAAK